MKTLIPFLLYGLPENYLLILAALFLLGLKIQGDRLLVLLVAGLCLGIFSYFARMYLFDLGLHTLAILFGLILTLVFWFKLSINTAVTGCFLSFFLLIMGESLVLSPILNLTRIPYEKMISNPWLHIALGWTSEVFLVIAILAGLFGGFSLLKAPEASKRI